MQEITPLISKKEQLIIDNQIEIDWLKQQIQQKKKMLAIQDINKAKIENLTDEEVNEELQTYSNQLADIRMRMDIMTQFNQSKIRINEALEDGHFTLDTFYPPQLLDDVQQQKRDQMEKLIKQRDNLVLDVINIQKQLKELQIKTAKLQANIVESHQANKQLMETFEKAKTESKKASKPTSGPYGTSFPEGIISDKISVSSSQFTSEKSVEKINEIKNRLEIAKNVLIVGDHTGK
ncbi:hypothetical protein BJ944DRAFT_71532 [Cunninghamella echinulata]|nr:hypothetical protein BJ944DRAFT_71532 [Cunninghamella echinulata]